jgi:hypothetical protein
LNKVLNTSGTDNPNYRLLIDNGDDDESYQITLSQLESVMLLTEKSQITLNSIYYPITQPVIDPDDTIRIDCAGYQQVMMNPRESTGTRTLADLWALDVDIENDDNLKYLVLRFASTGTISLQFFYQDVRCSNPGTIGTWDDVTQTIEITVTDPGSIWSLNFEKDETDDFYDMVVGGVAE